MSEQCVRVTPEQNETPAAQHVIFAYLVDVFT